MLRDMRAVLDMQTRRALWMLAATLCPLAWPQAPARVDARIEVKDAQKILDLRGALYHVQGVDFDDRHIWVTSVDRPHEKGYLHEFDAASGELTRSLEIQDGVRYHAGGLATTATSLWIPVAEYRANSTATIQRRNKQTFAIELQFAVPDHIGCVAVTPDYVIGGNWDSRDFYVWDHTGKLLRKVPSDTHNAYQDMKFEGGFLVASGSLADKTGAIDWIELPTFKLVKRIAAGVTDRGASLTREAMTIHGNQLSLLPEDGPSRLFVFNLPR